MSAVVAAFQPVFVTETGARSSSVGGAFLTETTVNYVGLAGNLAPSLTFTAGLTVVAGSAVTQQLVTSFTAGPDRGDFTGAVGEAFTPAIPMTFDKIGLRCGSGVLGSQQVAIGKDDGSNWLATVTIDLTGHALGEWVYVDIPAITLNAGTNYCLWSEVTAGNGYNWSDAAAPNAVTLRDCSSSTSAYGFSIHDVLHYGIGPGTMYVGVDLAVGVTVGGTVDLAGNLSPSATLAADLALTRDLAGDLAPSLAFAGDLSVSSISYVDLVGDLAPSTTFAASLTGIFSVAGDISPSATFGANLTITPPVEFVGDFVPSVSLAANMVGTLVVTGDLAPSVAFAADLTVVLKPVIYVDLAGNLGGGVSLYGMGAYGVRHYSRADASSAPFTPKFAGDLTGSFALGTADLAPQVTFAGDLSLIVSLTSDLPPLIGLDGELTFDLVIQGEIAFRVDFAASTLISKPLWEGDELCPPSDWTPIEPCPSTVWVSSSPPLATWEPSTSPPSLWTPTDSDSVEWEDTDLCNG